ncbi:MAG TPA: hypothetical protein VF251_04385, partial [Pyrinomonadaceae bacterium]
DLLAHLRDLLVTKVSSSEELLESAVCEPKELKRQAALFSESDLVRFFHSLADTETKLRTATQPRYQLEIGIVKLMQLRGVETIEQLMKRLAELEGTAGKGTSTSTQTPSGGSSPTSSGRQTTKPISGQRTAGSSFAATAASPALEEHVSPAREYTSLAAESIVPEPVSVASVPADAPLIERIKAALESRRKMFLVTVLDAAYSTSVDDGELFVEFKPDARHFRDTLSKPENAKVLRDACVEVTGREMGVRIAISDADDKQAAPMSKEDEERIAKQRLREQAESSPVVQQMLRTFRGEIVDVRRVDK